MEYDEKSALAKAAEYGLEKSYRAARRDGMSIQEALEEWDLWDYENDSVAVWWKRLFRHFQPNRK